MRTYCTRACNDGTDTLVYYVVNMQQVMSVYHAIHASAIEVFKCGIF